MSGDVKRYDILQPISGSEMWRFIVGSSAVRETPDGYWIPASDYDAVCQQLASLRGYCEERAQELGWPGYSQGGDPAAYLFDRIVELKDSEKKYRDHV